MSKVNQALDSFVKLWVNGTVTLSAASFGGAFVKYDFLWAVAYGGSILLISGVVFLVLIILSAFISNIFESD